MLNINNKVNYEINVKQKYSWSTVFAWLYLKTIGRMLPKKWNKWAENILYCNTTTTNNGVQTDGPADEGVQVPEVAKSQVMSKEAQATQTDGLTTVDESVQVKLSQEVAESEEDEGIYSAASGKLTDEDCSDIEVDVDNENYSGIEGELAWDDCCEEYRNDFLEKESEAIYSELEELAREIGRLSAKSGESDKDCFDKDISQVEACTKLYNEQNNLQVNDLLKKAMRKSKSILGRLEKNDVEIKRFSAELTEKSKLCKKSIKCNTELLREAKRPPIEVERDMKIASLKDLNSQLSVAEVENEKLKNEITELQEKVKTLEGDKKNAQQWKDDSHQTNTKLTAKSKTNLPQKNRALQAELNREKNEVKRQKNIISKKDKEIKKLKESNKKFEKNLQEKNQDLAKQKELVKQLQRPNSSMSYTNTVSVHSLNAQRVA